MKGIKVTLDKLDNYFNINYLIVTTLFFAGYGYYLSLGFNYSESIIINLTDPRYFIPVFLIFEYIISLLVLNKYERNYAYILRLKDKKNYIKSLFKEVIVTTTIVIIIQTISILIVNNIFGNFDVDYSLNFIPNTLPIIYILFLLFKLIIFSNLLILISLYVYKYFNKLLSILLYIIFCGYMLLAPNLSTYPISSIKDFKLLPHYYLTITPYSNFGIEVLFTLIYFLIIGIPFYLIIKKSKEKNFEISGV